jgi:hypothetical protein
LARKLLRVEELPRTCVIIEYWDVVFDLKQEAFVVTICWEEYGYSLKVTPPALDALLALFQASVELGGRVLFDCQSETVKLEFSGMRAKQRVPSARRPRRVS